MQCLFKPQNARERALKSPPCWINIPEFLSIARVARDLADNLAGGICCSKSGLNILEFCFSTKQNQTSRVDLVRLGSVIELNSTHKKFLVRLRSIAKPIELQSNDWVRLVFGSVLFD